MWNVRVIPCLLLRGEGLVKTVKFAKEKYVGDPMNAIRIFNEKGADELLFLDITASVEKRAPRVDYVREIAGECFMPLCYAGGVKNLEQMESLFLAGVEKVGINLSAFESPALVRQAAKTFGSQSVVVAVDVRKTFWRGYSVFTERGRVNRNVNPVDHARRMEDLGAGELLLTSIDRDGTMQGYDTELTEQVARAVSVPVIACGGAGCLDHFAQAVTAGASAVAAGSQFVFYGKHRAVLISYPEPEEIAHLSRAA